MSLFSWNKKDEAKLDVALSQNAPPEAPPEKLYVAFIELDTETIRCYRLNEKTMHSTLIAWGQQGCYLQRGSEPWIYIPPHRILKVTFRPEEEVKAEDEKQP